ncbi:uncharacterized protein LOC113207557 [Frankliniella occidentalis]|uniref:Uncharacterized protein LOC113207557 n=1 Tax=Frankliniella occidentalis TaxID=133901 RepID=A0A9C6TZV3_FRAOC|nr:uncharacterized protein LOC113207557 [Frankliniella occidentalis]
MKASLVCIVCFCAVAAMGQPLFENAASLFGQAAGSILGSAGAGAGASLGFEAESPIGKVGLHKEAHVGAGGTVGAQAQGAAGAQGAAVPVAPARLARGLNPGPLVATAPQRWG